jgi:hypothetical protein
MTVRQGLYLYVVDQPEHDVRDTPQRGCDPCQPTDQLRFLFHHVFRGRSRTEVSGGVQGRGRPCLSA